MGLRLHDPHREQEDGIVRAGVSCVRAGGGPNAPEEDGLSSALGHTRAEPGACAADIAGDEALRCQKTGGEGCA